MGHGCRGRRRCRRCRTGFDRSTRQSHSVCTAATCFGSKACHRLSSDLPPYLLQDLLTPFRPMSVFCCEMRLCAFVLRATTLLRRLTIPTNSLANRAHPPPPLPEDRAWPRSWAEREVAIPFFITASPPLPTASRRQRLYRFRSSVRRIKSILS